MAIQVLVNATPQPRTKKIPPRAESLLKYIIDSLITNARRAEDGETKVRLLPLVERAYAIVYETGTMDVEDYTPDDIFIKEQ